MITIDVSKYALACVVSRGRGPNIASGRRNVLCLVGVFGCNVSSPGPEAPPWDNDSCVVHCLSVNLNGLIPGVTNKLRHPRDPQSLLSPLFFPFSLPILNCAKTNLLNVAKSVRVLVWGVTFTLVSHHDGTLGSYFHSGVGIDAGGPSLHRPTLFLPAVDDGLFTLHHGVITGTFLHALRTHCHSLGRLAGYCLLEPRLLTEPVRFQQVCILERAVRRPFASVVKGWRVDKN